MKRRIRFMINTLEGGGAERVLVNLVNNLSAEDYEIAVVSVTGGVFENEFPDYVSYKKIVNAKNPFVKKLFEKIVYNLPYSLTAKLFLKGEYDIEAAYMHGFPTRVVACKCGAKAKTLAFVHGDFWTSFSVGGMYKDCEECLAEYKRFDRVCFVSQLALDGFKKRLGDADNLEIVHNIIDYKQVMKASLAEPPIRFETDGLKLVSVGRLTEVKGYERLLDAVKEAEKIHNFELIIIGDGDRRQALEKKIADEGIGSVRLAGFNSNPHCIVRQADWYICSSYQEAYNTSAAEAVSIGIPVLTTKCAGMNEILDNGKYGIICENDDSALSAAVENLFENCDYNKYKQAAVERSCELQTVNVLAEYDRLLKEELYE